MILTIPIRESFPAGDQTDQPEQWAEQVEKILREWLRQHSDDRSARYQLAKVLIQRGKFDEGLELFESLDGGGAESEKKILGEAQLYFDRNQYGIAVFLLRKLKRMSPDNEDIYNLKIRAWCEAMNRKSAPDTLQRIADSVFVSMKSDAPMRSDAPEAESSAPELETPTAPKAEPFPPGFEAPAVPETDFSLPELETPLDFEFQAHQPQLELTDNQQFTLETVKTLIEHNHPIQALELLWVFSKLSPANEVIYQKIILEWREKLGTGPGDEQPLRRDMIAEAAQFRVGSERHVPEPKDEPVAVEPEDFVTAPSPEIPSSIGEDRYRETLLKQKLEQNPEDSETRGQLASHYLQTREPDLAIEWYDRALQLDPGNLAFSLGIIRALIIKSEYQSSAELGKVLLEAYPGNETALTFMAKITTRLGQYEESIRYCRRLLDSNPGNRAVLGIMAANYRMLGRYEDGIETAKCIIEIDPGDVDALVTLAILHNCRNRNRSTRRYLEQANTLAPGRADVQAMLFQLDRWYTVGDGEITGRQRATALERMDIGHYVALGRVPGYLVQKEKTAGLYRTMLERDPGDLDALLGLGNMSFADGHRDTAESYYCQALDAWPGCEEARQALDSLSQTGPRGLSVSYLFHDLRDFDRERNLVEAEYTGSVKTVEYSHLASPKTRLFVRSEEAEYKQLFLLTGDINYHVRGSAASLGARHELPGNGTVSLRYQPWRFRNRGDNVYDLAGTQRDYTGYLVFEKENSDRLLTAGYWRTLAFNGLVGTPRAELAATDHFLIACDVDMDRNLSLVTSAGRLDSSTAGIRDTYRVRTRYRLPATPNIQLQCQFARVTNPEEDTTSLFVNLRDRTSRIRYWIDYGAHFQSLTDASVETHIAGLYLDFALNQNTWWYFDGTYAFDEGDDKDVERLYYTGLSLSF